MINENIEKISSVDLNESALTIPTALSTSLINSVDFLGCQMGSVNKLNPSVSKPSIIHFLSFFYAFSLRGTRIFFTRSCGFCIGTTLAGPLIDRFHDFGNTFLATAIFIMSAATFFIPFCYQLISLLPLQLVWGLAAGIVENLSQVLTIRYYSYNNVGSYLQALHSAFGIGAVVSPLIVAKLLSEQQYKNTL
ncbi:unnamed protein product [Rotaria magnacalcarata]